MTLAAVAALVLSACAKIETIETNEAISFGAYSGNSVTKSGTAGELNTTALQGTGFGVFAYQTTGNYAAGIAPNFMYNTNVSYSASAWSYSPVKYWPNQIQSGNTDSQPATAYQADKVSFFAYGPYVAHDDATTGEVADDSYGIIGFTTNAATTDPKVTYKVSSDLTKQVDLVWGVYTGSTAWTNVAGGTNTPTPGKPYLNLQKPAIGTAVHFYFKHALAQLNLKAVAAYNQTTAGGTAKNGVKITIASVEISVPGQYQTGVLNLNNTTANEPLWESQSGSAALALTVSGANINPLLLDAGDEDAADQPTGVTGTVQDVIVDGKYYTLIPKSGSTTVNVKVTYYVTTDDTDLLAGHSRVENVISKDVVFSSGFAAGTKNTIKMILGISEVEFEATVENWTDGTNAEVNLPLNS